MLKTVKHVARVAVGGMRGRGSRSGEDDGLSEPF